MPIILGVLVILILLWGGRSFLLSNPKLLATLIRGVIWAVAIVGIVVLVLSGRVLNVIIGLLALIPLWTSIQKYRQNTITPATPSPQVTSLPLTPEQAQKILGISKGASAQEIKAAHRRLIQKVHPDQGGSDFLTSQVNQAKDILLAELRKNTF